MVIQDSNRADPSLAAGLAEGLLYSDSARWLASAVDGGFNALLRAQRRRGRGRGRAGAPPYHERIAELEALSAQLKSMLTEGRHSVFRPPRRIEPAEQLVRSLPGPGATRDLLWPSEHQALLPELQARYERHPQNLRGAARLWTRREPRPVAVLIHGYMTGSYRLEERLWPMKWLYRQGLDLALLVLPLHGVRAIPARRGAPPFPSTDPRFTNEGLRHVIGDLRDLCGWLLEQGHPSVGVMGMSLGGYTAALAATVAAELSFAVPMVPVSCLADFARDQGRLDDEPERAAEEHRLLDAVHGMVSPLHRDPVVPPGRVMVLAGQADRVTPRAYAERLAEHFGASLSLWPGGHLMQLGRQAVLRRLRRQLAELGVLGPPGDGPS